MIVYNRCSTTLPSWVRVPPLDITPTIDQPEPLLLGVPPSCTVDLLDELATFNNPC